MISIQKTGHYERELNVYVVYSTHWEHRDLCDVFRGLAIPYDDPNVASPCSKEVFAVCVLYPNTSPQKQIMSGFCVALSGSAELVINDSCCCFWQLCPVLQGPCIS